MNMSEHLDEVRRQIGTGEEASADGSQAGRALWERSTKRRAIQAWAVTFQPGTHLVGPPRFWKSYHVAILGQRPAIRGSGATRSTTWAHQIERAVALS